MRRSLARFVTMLALIVPSLALVACGTGSSPAPASYPPGAVVVTANARKFDTTELFVPAGAAFTLVLVNKESDTHNIAIRTKAGFDGDLLFRHDPISASTVVLNVGVIPVGTYYFLCEVHPAMTGTVIAQ